jgi:hypothetical protein
MSKSVYLTQLDRNCVSVRIGEKTLIFSYDTLVAVYTGYKWYKTIETYSKTTSKHINKHVPANAELVGQPSLEQLAEV